MTTVYNGINAFSAAGRWAIAAKKFGTFPARASSLLNVSWTSGAACSFVSGFTIPMLSLLIRPGLGEILRQFNDHRRAPNLFTILTVKKGIFPSVKDDVFHLVVLGGVNFGAARKRFPRGWHAQQLP